MPAINSSPQHMPRRIEVAGNEGLKGVFVHKVPHAHIVRTACIHTKPPTLRPQATTLKACLAAKLLISTRNP